MQLQPRLGVLCDPNSDAHPPATQRDLLCLLTGEDMADDYAGAEAFDLPSNPTETDNTKQVISITKEQTVELLANIAVKSQQTLRMFAQAERVEIDDLIGDGKPYKG